MSLDLLGAEGLSGQYVVLRVKSIDPAKLQKKIGGTAGAAAPYAVALADVAPTVALNATLPLLMKKVREDYGIDLEYQVQDAPPPVNKHKTYGTGIFTGLAIAAGGWAAWRFGVSKIL